MNTSKSNSSFKKIWIIDDNKIELFLAKKYNEICCFAEEAVLLNSARQGLELLKSLENNPDQLPQFIFLDIRMPVMDGFDFLREYEKFPDSVKLNCIIIMLSSSMDPEDHEKIKKNPLINQFISKPLTEAKLKNLKSEFSRRFS